MSFLFGKLRSTRAGSRDPFCDNFKKRWVSRATSLQDIASQRKEKKRKMKRQNKCANSSPLTLDWSNLRQTDMGNHSKDPDLPRPARPSRPKRPHPENHSRTFYNNIDTSDSVNQRGQKMHSKIRFQWPWLTGILT